MAHISELRRKYPKWAHRHKERKKRRRRSRSRRRRKRKGRGGSVARHSGMSTEHMLVGLLNQLLLVPRTLARKHGENVITGSAGVVKPGHLAPVWSAHERNYILGAQNPAQGGGAGAGAGAAAVIGGAPSRRRPGRMTAEPLVPGRDTMSVRPPGRFF